MSYADMEIESNSKFLKIESGKPMDLHILSQEPTKTIVHGFGADKVNCAGKNCSYCENGETPKQRWLTNVYVWADEKVKVWEFGSSIAKQIKAIAEMLKENDQTIHDVDLRIKAEGEGLAKEYTVMQKPMTKKLPLELPLHKI